MQLTKAGRLMETGGNGQAKVIYETILESLPDTPIALNNLAWIYGEGELDKAVEAAERAYEMAPESGEIADTLGWFVYKAGDKKKGLELLEKAAKLIPEHKDIVAHLEEVRANQ